MSLKRLSSSRTSEDSKQTKKMRNIEEPAYLYTCLQQSGLTLQHPPKKCIALQETVNIVRNLKRNLQKHYDYPMNVMDLVFCFEKECEDIDIFKYYLYPNIVRSTEDSPTEHPVSDSFVKILMSVPVLQTKVMDIVFNKAISLSIGHKCTSWIQMILKCFTTLDSIVSTEKMATNIMNLLDVSTEKMVRLEIITAIPDILGDQEHEFIATKMGDMLDGDDELIPAVLDCLSYLCLSDDQYQRIQQKALINMKRTCYYPSFVKFLLNPNLSNNPVYLQIVPGIRNALFWSESKSNAQEVASSQVLTMSAIRNSIISSKSIANCWFKTLAFYKDHKPIDFILLLVMYTTSDERQRQVENLVKKQIKQGVLQEKLLIAVFKDFTPILTLYLQHLIELTNYLLKLQFDPLIESFASYIYIMMLTKLEDCRPRVLAELLQLGLDRKQCIMSTLSILNKVAAEDKAVLKPQSIQMLTLLDRMDDLTLNEIREIMNLICCLAYSFENAIIKDDVHMIIRKELGSSNPSIKMQGILAGVHAVKYLMASATDEDHDVEIPDEISYSSTSHLPDGAVKESAQIIELISCSTHKIPDLIAFFYDELSNIMSRGVYINKQFLTWLTEAVTNDLQQNFIVDCVPNDIGQYKLKMSFCLNADSEMDELIAINIAGLTLNPKENVNIKILSPLFQLVQILHSKQHDGNLASIDALLGCPVIMPQYDLDLIEDYEIKTVHMFLDCLIHCVNWFRELLNAFAIQTDTTLKSKIFNKILQIQDIEDEISKLFLSLKGPYKPPMYTFDVSKYVGEFNEKQNKSQSKTKNPKKNVNDDTVLTDTVKSQGLQINIKNKFEVIQHLPLRSLNMNILKLLDNNLSSNQEVESELNIKIFKFLLKCVIDKLSNVLISRTKNTNPFKQTNVIFDSNMAEKTATNVNELLPKLVLHIKYITDFIEQNTKETPQDDSEFLYSLEMCDHLLCLEYLFYIFTTYFKWIGFKNINDNELLISSLNNIAGNDTSSISIIEDLCFAVVKYFQMLEKYCFQLSTATALLELIKTLQELYPNSTITNVVKDMALNLLKQQWKTPEGALEKGSHFNKCVDKVTEIYVINNNIMDLKNLALQLTTEIENLKGNKDTLSTLKCISKNNFSVLYKHLGKGILEATKKQLEKILTNSEYLVLWKDVVMVLKYMSEIAKNLDNRSNLSSFFKQSLSILKLFLSKGMHILEKNLKTNTQEVLSILKVLQQSTRFLQSLCCHSRLKKDTALMVKVPLMRKILETLIYKVKAALAANNCSGAFWMGNLKNKNIHGEVIASQQSVSEESADDCDNQLPDDDSAEIDEMVNDDSNSISDVM